MTRSELIARLASRYPQLTQKDAELSVHEILEAIQRALTRRDRVEIRNFGSFDLSRRPPRNGRNPKTGESAPVPAKSAPHFKPGKDLRERVDYPAEPKPSRLVA